ncbi:MAG: efflux RND transporter periplasmic adaptor subunit [Pirellulales bacterium]
MNLAKQLPLGAAVAVLACSVVAVTPVTYAQPNAAALVAVSPAIEEEVEVTQAFVGTVMPSKTAVIGSAVDGRVIEFPFNAGDRVEANEPLAKLLTDTAQLELTAAQAELDLRRQELAELENGTRPEEVEQARARRIAAEARKTFVAAKLKRTEQLYEDNQAISEEERDEVVSLAVAADQALIEAEKSLNLAELGPRDEQIAQARAQVAIQQAVVEQLEDRIVKHTIISRFAGYVTAEHTEIGQWLKRGDPVADVVALDEVEVVAQVSEQHVQSIRLGLVVQVEVPALPGRTFTGTVIAIVPQADVQARGLSQ